METWRSLKEYTPEQIQAAVNLINNAGPGVQIPASLLPVVGALLDDQASIGTAVKTGLDFSKLGWLSGLVGEGLIGIGNTFDDNDNVITRWGHGLLHPDEAIDYISDMYSKITTGKDSIDKFNDTGGATKTPIGDEYLATREYIKQMHAQKAAAKLKQKQKHKQQILKNQYKSKLRKLLIHQLNHKEMIIWVLHGLQILMLEL